MFDGEHEPNNKQQTLAIAQSPIAKGVATDRNIYMNFTSDRY